MTETKLLLKRRYFAERYTIGKLYINGQPFCDTLEDTDRGLVNTMTKEEISKIKIYAETAIPKGKYNVIINVSPKYKRELPRLLNVPGYEGILIHAGNTHEHTAGCILVGENKEKGKVLNSRSWERKLMELLKPADKITIEII